MAKSKKLKSRPVAFVYVLGSFHKGRYISYVGWTNDVTQRLEKHNAGTGARSTRGRTWTLLHTEPFTTRNEAMSREWHLKRDRAFRKKLMDGVRAAAVIASEAKQSMSQKTKTGLLRRLRSSQ
ncbi:GIY-YIG nuclease family protein [Afipia massiliensis]|uniref:GIY-YIG nuclease family protein n=1 Tax=Afipia massiliensis TaxID=211460 RepID=A0A4U6BYN0_9BRAD|nr:GIY-YIG nuclease family protein [Afipia massiliensis]TKT73984.1 GIY-YIG nuclease family protein [Afipia massiliensis]